MKKTFLLCAGLIFFGCTKTKIETVTKTNMVTVTDTVKKTIADTVVKFSPTYTVAFYNQIKHTVDDYLLIPQLTAAAIATATITVQIEANYPTGYPPNGGFPVNTTWQPTPFNMEIGGDTLSCSFLPGKVKLHSSGGVPINPTQTSPNPTMYWSYNYLVTITI